MQAFLSPTTAHRNVWRLVVANAFVGIVLFISLLHTSAEEVPSFVSLREGLYSESKELRPGKVDLLFKDRKEQDQFNAFLWTPLFKGGGGVIDPSSGPNTIYGGGFVRPLEPWPDKGDLILGGQAVELGSTSQFEVQGEYRLPFGLGFGGGYVSTPSSRTDVSFGKLTFRNKWRQWNYILEMQGQDTADRTKPGGYIALYDDQWMGVFGNDGEQWRVTTAFVASEKMKYFRPVVEVLYVDNSIGQINGPKVLFANATLKYEGGFLSHAARLGRAMGPQGLEFGNPLGFLTPTFNRRLEIWEMGILADFRAERIELRNHLVQERYEASFYPAQFQRSRSKLDGLFFGAAWSKARGIESPAVLAGLFSQVGFLRLSVGIEHEIDPSHTSLVIGVIDHF